MTDRESTVRDVALREGLQLTGKPLPIDRKIDVVRRLLGLGVPGLEIGSPAGPDLVPPLADTLDLVERLTPAELARCWVWVATPHVGARRGAAGRVDRRCRAGRLRARTAARRAAEHHPAAAPG